AIIPLVSANGPCSTVRLVPENRTRAPLVLACRPSPASRTPAFASSSLYFPIAVSSSVLGSTPASVSSLAFSSTMNRIVSPSLPCRRPRGRQIDSRRNDARSGACAALREARDRSGQVGGLGRLGEVLVEAGPQDLALLFGTSIR